MQLRFLLRIHHTSIRGIETGAFVAEFVESSGLLKSGTFHFGDAGEVEFSEVQRIAETSDLTKGLRRREQQVRFVCVLKAKPEGETAESENDEADDPYPYFCATIDKNGWTLIKTILDKHNKKHEVFSHV